MEISCSLFLLYDFHRGAIVETMVDFSSSVNALRNIGISQRVVANNLANVESTGFKESRTVQGTQSASVTANQTQGGLIVTNNLLDFAINGNGYIAVSSPEGTAYSRSGTLSIDKNGVITDNNGNPLKPQVSVPTGTSSIAIQADGVINADLSGNATSIGQLSITTFPNPGGLKQTGDNLLQESLASGQPLTNTPGTGGAGNLVLGGIERSNVSVSDNIVTMIINRNAFAYNAKAITVQEDMDRVTLSIKG